MISLYSFCCDLLLIPDDAWYMLRCYILICFWLNHLFSMSRFYTILFYFDLIYCKYCKYENVGPFCIYIDHKKCSFLENKIIEIEIETQLHLRISRLWDQIERAKQNTKWNTTSSDSKKQDAYKTGQTWRRKTKYNNREDKSKFASKWWIKQSKNFL